MRAAPHAVRLAALTAVLILIFCFVQPVSAQPGITSPEVEYEFGRSITFRASLEASSPSRMRSCFLGQRIPLTPSR